MQTDKSTLFFVVRKSYRFPDEVGVRQMEVTQINTIPKRNVIDSFYIQLYTLSFHKSHFNETNFYDFEVKLWLDSDTPYDLKLNGWQLDILQLPRGRGRQNFVYRIIDPRGNELLLKRLADTRSPIEFCYKIAEVITQFQKASMLPSILHHVML